MAITIIVGLTVHVYEPECRGCVHGRHSSLSGSRNVYPINLDLFLNIQGLSDTVISTKSRNQGIFLNLVIQTCRTKRRRW